MWMMDVLFSFVHTTPSQAIYMRADGRWPMKRSIDRCCFFVGAGAQMGGVIPAPLAKTPLHTSFEYQTAFGCRVNSDVSSVFLLVLAVYTSVLIHNHRSVSRH